MVIFVITLLQTGEEGADVWLSWGEVKAGCEHQELCAGWPGAVWELLMGVLHLSGSRLHFQLLV